MTQTQFYLAYGSNLNMRAMRVRCPGAMPDGIVLLENARLVFRGVADVVFDPGHTVPCGLWRITPRDERSLDAYEGVSGGLYYKDEVPFRDTTALIYTMSADGIFPPSQYYADVIREGYADFGLDTDYLEAAITYSWKRKEPCPMTIARRQRQKAKRKQRQLVPMPESLARKMLERRLTKYLYQPAK